MIPKYKENLIRKLGTNSKIIEFILIMSFAIILFFSIVPFDLITRSHAVMQFDSLAQSFTSGHLYFSDEFVSDKNNFWGTTNMVQWGNKYYWPNGPFPSVLIIPFMIVADSIGLHIYSYQGFLNILLAIGVFIFCYKIAGKQGFSKNNSLLLATTFCFGSAFIGASFVPSSWYFAQTVTTFLLFWVFFEYFSKKRWIVIGSILGFIALTRVTAAIAVSFFVLDILTTEGEHWKLKFVQLSKLLVPFGASILTLGLYNYARSTNFFDQGYMNQLVDAASYTARSYGLFSFEHIPGNLYYFLLHGPLPVFKDTVSHVLTFPFLKPDKWGMSIFFTSPYFIYLFFINHKNKISKLLIVSIVLIALPVFMYYGIGYSQFGYRYALDFTPLLFIVFMRGIYATYHNLPFKLKLLLVCSIFLNLYLFLSLYEMI